MLRAVKVGGLKEKSAIWHRPHSNRSAHVGEQPGSNHSQSLMAGKFEALWPTEPIFTVLKDLNLFKNCIKNQEASNNFRIGFALSKRSRLHRAYLVTDRKRGARAVYARKLFIWKRHNWSYDCFCDCFFLFDLKLLIYFSRLRLFWCCCKHDLHWSHQ